MNIYYKIIDQHFEKIDKLNGPYPSYSDVTVPDSGWTKLPDSMSVYHQNGVGEPELKFVNPDGREAVFDGDTLQPITDPRYKWTYNYVTPVQTPNNIFNIVGWDEFEVKGI